MPTDKTKKNEADRDEKKSMMKPDRRHDKNDKDNKDNRGNRDSKENRDHKDNRDNRDNKDNKDNTDREKIALKSKADSSFKYVQH